MRCGSNGPEAALRCEPDPPVATDLLEELGHEVALMFIGLERRARDEDQLIAGDAPGTRAPARSCLHVSDLPRLTRPSDPASGCRFAPRGRAPGPIAHALV